MSGLRIAFATSEVAPFVKTGGLADVSGALPRELARSGHDVRLFAPLYAESEEAGVGFEREPLIQDVAVRMGDDTYRFSAFRGEPDGGPRLYFIDCPALFHRDRVYTQDPDEHRRFVLLTRAVLESCQRLQWAPDVFHVNDWQTALLPLYLKTRYAWDRDLFAAAKTVLTLHNVGYQGTFASDAVLSDAGLRQDAHLLHQGDLGRGVVSLLRTGILYADVLTTVSPTYAREIRTAAYGMGLEDLLRARAATLVGILNGVDYDEWSPEADAYLPHPYGADSLERKRDNTRHLLGELRLAWRDGVPTVGVVSRLTGQKGLELVLEVLPRLLRRRLVRFVLLGSGEPELERRFGELERAFPDDVAFYRGFSDELAHLIEGGADLFLMPSRYEPCGLNQMYSLRYGTVPVVRNTGGLADSVELYDPDTGAGTGFVFDHFSVAGLAWALTLALRVWDEPKAWRRLQLNGMARDFSWATQAKQYEGLYRQLVS